MNYKNAKAVIKIDNTTNKVVGGNWQADVYVFIHKTTVKLVGIPFTVDGANAIVHYEMYFPG